MDGILVAGGGSERVASARLLRGGDSHLVADKGNEKPIRGGFLEGV